MARMNFNPETAEQSLVPVLLPVEHEENINGIVKKIPTRYLAEITSAKEMTSKKSGSEMLKLGLAIDFEVEAGKVKRVYIDDFMSYQEKAIFRLAGLLKMLGISMKDADTDNLIGRNIYVNVIHAELVNETTGEKTQINKIARFVGMPTIEELKAMSPDPINDMPF